MATRRSKQSPENSAPTHAVDGSRQVLDRERVFLEEIERWRDVLAHNIVLRNPGLRESALNGAVQRIVDRIVFLRICENRGIEKPGLLANLLEGDRVYARLCERFQQAGEKYPTGLFPAPHERDKPTEQILLDDAPLREILEGLTDARRAQLFSDIPADMLGRVYERFLGNEIRLTADGGIRIEQRPEVRKAGGVFYTPTYIVDAIVQSTVGLLVKDRTPKDVTQIRILDPACGSGSFLLGAYQFLLDWHRTWYRTNRPGKWAQGRNPAMFRSSHGEWQLTTNKRLEILANNIFGVDLDAQAIEVTKWSLLLAALEGQQDEARNKNLSLFPDRLHPHLEKNIRRGNSLIGLDFLEDGTSKSDNENVVPFDWKDAFPEVFGAGGFDAVLGNPPYLSYGGRQSVDVPARVRTYLLGHYESAGWPTAHSFFMERSVKLLSRRFLSFIVPDQVGHLEGYRSIREILGKHSHVREVRYWGESVFRGVTTPALTFVLDKEHTEDTTILDKDGSSHQVRLQAGDVWSGSALQHVLQKLRLRSLSLKPYLADCGIRTTAAKEQVVALDDAQGQFVPALEGKQIGRYRCSPPEIAVRLDTGRDVFKSKAEKYENACFVLRQTAPYPIVAPHEHTLYFRNSLHGLFAPDNGLDIRYIVGLLNSKLMRFAYVETIREAQQRTFPQVKLGALATLPIRSIDMQVPAEKAKHDAIVDLVEWMLRLQKKLATQHNAKRIASVRRQIQEVDDEIDKAVYALYELTDADMAAVEKVVAGLVTPP